MFALSLGKKPASLALVFISLVGFFLTVLSAMQLGLDKAEPSNRARFHAIPVALSQLYHGRSHDYTANWSIAVSFQGSSESTQSLIEKHAELDPPAEDGDYYWTADDRGFSDFVYGAFALFGPNLTSLFYFWFLVLGLSLALALVRFFNDLAALAFVTTSMMAVGASISIYDGATNQFSFRENSIHISESRMIGILGIIALLHILLSIYRSERAVPVWLNLGTLFAQIGIITFLLHTRSTILWLFLAILVSGIGVFAHRLLSANSSRSRKIPLIVLAFTISSFAGLKAYQAVMFHPAYFDEIGPRTVWHNAIMGTSYSPTISKILNTDAVDDGAAIEAVLRSMKQQIDARLTEAWERQNILNSLGGHNSFDWVTYEKVARELYLRTLVENPGAAVRMFLWDKPKAVIDVIWCKNLNMPIGCMRADNIPESSNRSAWSVIWFFLAVSAAGILNFLAKKERGLSNELSLLNRQMFVPVIAASLIGVLPGYLFYPATTSTAGATVVLMALAYFIGTFLCFSILQYFQKSRLVR